MVISTVVELTTLTPLIESARPRVTSLAPTMSPSMDSATIDSVWPSFAARSSEYLTSSAVTGRSSWKRVLRRKRNVYTVPSGLTSPPPPPPPARQQDDENDCQQREAGDRGDECCVATLHDVLLPRCPALYERMKTRGLPGLWLHRAGGGEGG